MNNQGTKPGDVIGNSFIKKSIPKIKTIHDVYPKDCLNGTFEIQQASFVDHLCLGRHKDAKLRDNSEALYIVTKNYRVTYDYTVDRNDGKGEVREKGKVTVPALMCTDLATIPFAVVRWALDVGRVGPHLEATIVHDFLYIAWQLFHGANDQHAKSEYKAFADDLCYYLLKASGIGWIKRQALYIGMDNFIARWWYFEEREEEKEISIPEDEDPCPCP